MLKNHLIHLISSLRDEGDTNTLGERKNKWSLVGNVDNCPTN